MQIDIYIMLNTLRSYSRVYWSDLGHYSFLLVKPSNESVG